MRSSKLDVSLLSGLRSDTRAHFLEAGITTLDQIVALQPEDLCQFRGIKTTAPRIHAHARAWVEQQPIWYNPLPEHCHQEGFMFDLETNPWTGEPWSLSWSWGTGTVSIALVAPDQKARTLDLPDGQRWRWCRIGRMPGGSLLRRWATRPARFITGPALMRGSCARPRPRTSNSA